MAARSKAELKPFPRAYADAVRIVSVHPDMGLTVDADSPRSITISATVPGGTARWRATLSGSKWGVSMTGHPDLPLEPGPVDDPRAFLWDFLRTVEEIHEDADLETAVQALLEGMPDIVDVEHSRGRLEFRMAHEDGTARFTARRVPILGMWRITTQQDVDSDHRDRWASNDICATLSDTVGAWREVAE